MSGADRRPGGGMAALVRQAAAVTGASRRAELSANSISAAFLFGNLPSANGRWGCCRLFDLTDFAALPERFSAVLTAAGQYIAAKALRVGGPALGLIVSFFVQCCTCCFSCCATATNWQESIRMGGPLQSGMQNALFRRFTAVIHATVEDGDS